MVRRHRFGFLHALAMVALLATLPFASALVAWLLELGHQTLRSNTVDRPVIAVVDEQPAQRPIAEEFFPPPKYAPPDLWTRGKLYGSALLSTAKRSFETAWRAQGEARINRAFAELDQSNPRQARAFLSAHGNSSYAEQLGYVAAVRRAMAEHRLYRSRDVVGCGDCWCWRERPATPNDTAATQ